MTGNPSPAAAAAPLSDAAVESLRARTPGTRTTVHFNHAGASLPSADTLDAVRAHLLLEAERGPIEAASMAMEQAEQARALGAALFNAEPSEVALTTGNSAGWGSAFAALGPWKPGDRILVGRHEWGGNVAAMRLLAGGAGASIEVIPSDDAGTVDPDALQAMIDDRVRLISVTWLPANGGLINPAARVGEVARRHGIPYFIDAAQAAGQLPIDVRALGCDVLAAVGRKALRAPRGTGLLYVRRDFLPRLTPAMLDAHSAPLDGRGEPAMLESAARFEPAERSYALLCGLASALRQALDIGIDAIRARVDRNASVLREELAGIPGVRVLDQGRERSGLVSFAIEGMDAGAVAAALGRQGISIGSNGVRYTPFDMLARGLTDIARASVSYLTTDAEIGRLTEAVRKLAAGYMPIDRNPPSTGKVTPVT
ncbi:aminotransferase class V-fold PLP-dependent enzyme [Bordetella genomosp. 9]|uniref:Aminotransferase n=1 Tax=Bordetella genomosp. 9 TaxID=1416803 RepID=A0A1W6YX09_9BORD|nr:aminotransferase class V-fold PLP-dependent enzyme [Bordetella genomosp. 9]ARP85439.1 aminotransferase [Bordetella genomosp. 9]